MKFVDYYKIMGLEDNASDEEIRKAYRRLARKYHPDVSKEDDCEARFKEIGEAYSVLKDAEKRKEYDLLKAHGGRSGEEFTPPPGWHSQGGFSASDFGDMRGSGFSDFFEQLFGAGAYQRSSSHGEQSFSAKGQDLHANISVSLDTAFAGGTIPLKLQAPVFQSDGSIHNEQKSLRVTIPKGVVNGQKIRLRGQGGPALGNAVPGDLYLEISITDDERFHIDGRDIIATLSISPWEAALGATIEVPTLAGKVNLTVPAGAKTDQKLRLKGRGMPGATPGDQYVILKINAPVPQTTEQRDLYRRMSTLWDFNPRRASGG